MPTKYALLREGTSDIALKIIVERYGATRGLDLQFEEALSQPFGGSFSKQTIRIRTRNNFDTNRVDLAFYFADNDKGNLNKFDILAEAIRSVNELYLTKSIIGIPDPHFEAWLLADQNTVKRIFNSPSDQPLPYADLSPKRQLEELADHCGDDELTPPEARRRLAQELNIATVEQQCPSFAHFVRQYNTYCNALSQHSTEGTV